MKIPETERQAIQNFVQGVLGCGCPNEIFNKIDIEQNPLNFSDISEGVLISIGGQLLIYLINTNDALEFTGKLERIFSRGQELRDNSGFNRFRLVIATRDSATVREILNQTFQGLEGMDSRMHFHLIDGEQIPTLSSR